MWRTLADVTALRIDAISVLACLWIIAFIYICAIATGFVQLEALVTDASEHSVDIFTFTEDAQVAKHLAFVDIDARLLVALIRVHETHFALAAERSWIVEALPVLTQRRII